MNPLTREWTEKAEGDYHAAVLLLRARKHPNYDAACFHAQQCAEKYMKAVLHEARLPFDRTHVLPVLLDQLMAVNPMWDAVRDAAKVLADAAVRFRYPGSRADRAMAKNAVRACEFIREPLRQHLGLRAPVKKRTKKKSIMRRRPYA